MNNCQNMLLPSCGVCISLSRRAYDVFIGEYWSSHTNFYSSLLRFSVLVIMKQQKCLLLLKKGNCYNTFYPSCRYWTILSHRGFYVCFCNNTLKLHLFIFVIIQIQCLGNQKIVETWLLLHEYEELPQFYLPYCRVWKILFHRSLGIFLWVNVGLYIVISIYRHSDSVSWLSKNSRKVALAP